MDFEIVKKTVDHLNDQAVSGKDATDALKWTQAALNAANAYATLKSIQRG